MENGFKDFAVARCEKAIENDIDYMDSENSGILDHDELQVKAEVLCYFQGMKDMAQFMGINTTNNLTFDILGSHGSQKR